MKIEWTMETLDNRSVFMRNIASNTTIKHKNTIIKEQEAFQKGVAKGYRMALQDLGIIKKEGEKDAN